MIPCPEGRFAGNTNITKNIGLEGSYMCPKNLNNYIEGDFSTKGIISINLAVKLCDE